MDRLTWFLVWDAIGRTWLPLFGVVVLVIGCVGVLATAGDADTVRRLIGLALLLIVMCRHHEDMA